MVSKLEGRAMKTKLLAACLVLVGFPVVGLALPEIEVLPPVYDFGNVEVGTSSTTIITIASVGGHPLELMTVWVKAESSPDFSVTYCPVLPRTINPGCSVEVEVTFSPTESGYASAVLKVIANDPYEPEALVDLIGMGVEEEPPPEELIQDILDFIELAVDAGVLSGSGPGNSANNRLNALVNMIEAAGDLIEDGYYEQAYDQLATVYEKCDGQDPPPDFVEGSAREELAEMISDLTAVLELLMI
jgi:hypothetical protein